MPSSLYFRFKGSRNYIQGGDIFDAVEQAFEDEASHVIGLVFRRFSHQQLALVTEDPGPAARTEGIALSVRGARFPFWLVETGEAVTERYPFDEAAITSGAHVEGNTVRANGIGGFSIMEQVVALTKALNYARSPNVDGKWVFAQLQLTEALPSSVHSFEIHQKTLISNRFSTQNITLDGKYYGEIRFITAKP